MKLKKRIFNFYKLFCSFIFIKRIMLIKLAITTFFLNIIINNFDNIRFQLKVDEKGNKYTHDLLTGKKWKKISYAK